MKLFATYTGAWNTKVSMWTSPADQPMEHEIKMDGSMEMNGLFFTAHYHGEMMGMEYEAIGTIGYYPSKGYYESTWIDNQNANIFYLQGKLNEKGNAIDFKGSFSDPVSSQEIQVRHLYSRLDSSHLKLEIFNGSGGNEMKTYEFDIIKR